MCRTHCTDSLVPRLSPRMTTATNCLSLSCGGRAWERGDCTDHSNSNSKINSYTIIDCVESEGLTYMCMNSGGKLRRSHNYSDYNDTAGTGCTCSSHVLFVSPPSPVVCVGRTWVTKLVFTDTFEEVNFLPPYLPFPTHSLKFSTGQLLRRAPWFQFPLETAPRSEF